MFFSKPYKSRFEDIVFSSVIFVILFKFLILFEISKVMHGINIIQIDVIIIVFSILGILLAFMLSYKESKEYRNNLIFFVLMIFVFFSVLTVLQLILEFNQINIQSEDITLIFIQLILILVFINLFYKEVILENEYKYILLFLLLSFIFFLIFKLLGNFTDLATATSFLTTIFFWFVLISLIFVNLTRPSNSEYKKKMKIALFIGFFLGFGMAMGMTRREVLTAVITEIIDQFFSLFVVSGSLPGINFNPELLMIFINSIIGFVFLSVITASFLLTKSRDERLLISACFLIGISGLNVLPFYGIIRLIGLYYLFNYKLIS